MLVKVTAELMTAIGATAENFSDKLTAFVASSKRIETVMTEDFSKFEGRMVALETAVKNIPTAEIIGASVQTAVASAVPAAMTAWAGSEPGKKLIGAEASRITAEAMAAIGTMPAKPSPASAGAATGDQAQNFITAGKFEEAYPLLTEEARSEFPDAKSYAAFQRAAAKGQVRFSKTSRN